MTQPVQEPTQGRMDQGQDWRTRQLFRRPSPAAALVPTMYDMGDVDIIITTGTAPSGYDSGWFLSWDGVNEPAPGTMAWGWIRVGISDLDDGGTDGTGFGDDSRGYEMRTVPDGFGMAYPLGGFGKLLHKPDAVGDPTDLSIFHIYPEPSQYGDRLHILLTNYDDTTVGRTLISTGVVKPSWPFPTGTVGAPATEGWSFTYWYTVPTP